MDRVYISCRYSRRDEMRNWAKQLEENGYVISSSWLNEDYALNIKITELTPATNLEIAEKDIEDVIGSDVFIFVAEDMDNQPPRGGRHVEFGYALALGLRIYVVGKEENVFHYLPMITVVPSFEELIAGVL